MPSFEVLAIALALSLDAFAVSLAAGASGLARDRGAVFRLSFHFGLFQFLMPIVGWALGTFIEPFVAAVDHWVAFGLLAVVGIRMIRSGIASGPEVQMHDPSRGWTLAILAIATSIDAMAIGLGLAMLHVPVWYPSIVIGIVTAGVSAFAILGGQRIGASMGRRAQVGGGALLLLIGVRIAVSHLV
jgi:manganese efflux pump family protein